MKNNMKPGHLISIMLAVFMLSSFHLAAQSNLTIRPIGKSEFLFSSLQDPLLFPETAFAFNPAVLANLKTGFLLTDLRAALSRDTQVDKRLDSSTGSLAGTRESLEQTFLPGLGITHLFPVGKKTPALFGYSLNGNIDYRLFRDLYTDYNSFSEKMTVVEEELPASAQAGFYLSLKQKTVSLGFYAGYGLSFEPKLYRMATDESFIPPETYVQEELRNADIWTHQIFARAGLVLPLSRAAEVSIAAAYQGGFADASAVYKAFDTNGNGTNDGLMLNRDYVFYTGAGGPETRALSFEGKDLTISTAVILYPNLRVYLSDKLEMFITGNYRLFDFSDRTFYTHIQLPSDLETDQSLNHEVHNRSYTSFTAMPGIAIKPDAATLLKFGAGYGRLEDRLTQDGLTIQGLTLYNRLNTGNYAEISLGLEPVNDILLDEGIAPSLSLTQSVLFLMALEHRPSAGISLHAGLEVRGSMMTETYRAYNLDTRSIWSETVSSASLAWELLPAAGIAVKAGKNITWVINLKGTGISGNLGMNTETAPFDDFSQRTTLNGSRDLTSSTPVSLEVNTSFLFSK
ncbi:MAG: hypothetical protein E4H36_15930 [Spirochaetales bacterium]|nr:MAG: hypothetical protein E4H36_15930 [Spirochaetales bacterium]